MDLAHLDDFAGRPETFRSLADAVSQLNARGLVLSAQWAAQMLSALPPPEHQDAPVHAPLPTEPIDSTPTYLLAKTYFDARQYRRAASTLKSSPSPPATFLRLYSTYLAGEKRKEEERQELAGWTEPVNLQLAEVRDQIVNLQHAGNTDPLLMYLLGVVLKRLHLPELAIDALVQSIDYFPYNWGAWLELVPLCKSAELIANLVHAPSWIKALFHGYYLNENDQPEQAREIYERLVLAVPDSCHIRSQLALALYNLRLFDEAQGMYDDIFDQDPHCLDGVDVYSNILYVKEDKVQLSVLANRCIKVDKFRLETCCVIGNYYSLRGQHEQAVAYFQRALKLNRDYLSAWTLMGHEFVEMKNTAAAVEAYRRAVDINPKDFRAWYGLGQVYELLNLPLYTLYYFRKAAALRPRDSRMWCAAGNALQELHRWDEATRCYERAVNCDDREGAALAKLAYLYERMARDALRDGRQAERSAKYSELAAQYYTANLARRDEEKLGGPETASALKFLADHCLRRNELARAEEYCVRLFEYSGQDKEYAKKLMRQVHSTMRDARVQDLSR